MLKVWLVPVAYVAGIEGFGWFVPYLLFVCAVATVRRMTRRAGLAAPVIASQPAHMSGVRSIY